MRLKLPEFEKCCCCIPLVIGCKLFAYIYLIANLLIIGLIGFLKVNLFLSDHKWLDNALHFEIVDIGGTLNAVFGIYALVGIYEKKLPFLFAWVVYLMSAVLLSLFHLISAVILGNYKHPTYIIIEILFIVAITYVSTIFYSYYKKLQLEKTNDRNVTGQRETDSAI